MKRLISKVTLQVSFYNGFTVFTEYNRNSNDYGFTPYPTLEKAQEEAAKMTKVWDKDFMSIVDGYNVINFDEDGNETTSFVEVSKK